MCALKLWFLLVVLATVHPAESLRKTGMNLRSLTVSDGVDKTIAGVPVYNYELAFSSADRKISSSASREGQKTVGVATWVCLAKPSVGDDLLNEICNHRRATCLGKGHGSGVPFIKVKATEDGLHDLLQRYRGHIEFVEPDLEVKLPPPLQSEIDDDVAIKASKRASSWGLERIGVTQSNRTGRGVHVYVLDTGVFTTHRDFEGRAIPTLDCTTNKFWQREKCTTCRSSDKRCAMDRQGHGTHCAGTIGGKTYGVAKEATVHAVKVLADDGRGQSSWIVGAMDWVTRNAQRPAIMSMSLGGKGKSRAYEAAINQAVKVGITVVVAAGNENDNACGYSPAFVKSAITVGATSSGDVRAHYSNFGSCVQIYAPGTNIRSAGIANDRQSAEMSGTSMACPHVAGAAALLLGEDASLTPTKIFGKLMSTSIPDAISGLTRQCPNNLLNVKDAKEEEQIAPPSSGDALCPSFAKYRSADGEGDCQCKETDVCWSGGSKGCTFSGKGNNDRSSTFFSADCKDCKCKPKKTVDSPNMLCNEHAVSRTPDAEGDCKCPFGTVCSTGGFALKDCPYSGSGPGKFFSGQYFKHTCSTCTCTNPYQHRPW